MDPAMVAQLQALLRQRADADQPLLDIKAGRLTMKADGFTVTADHRRGRLQLVRGEDGLLHLKWVLRPGGQVELDRMLLPGAATVEAVPECKDGRVWLVRLDGSKLFFWLQEPSAAKDQEWLDQANRLFRERQQPAIPGVAGAGAGVDGLDPALLAALGGAGGGDMQDVQDEEAQLQQILEQSRREALQQQQQQQQQQPRTGSPPSGSSSASSGAAAGISQEQARMFAQQLQSMAAAALRAQQEADQLRLTDVLKSERVAAALDDDAIRRLAVHLPASQQSAADLRAQLSSPQLRQALNHLQQVCGSPEYSQLLLSLRLPMDADMGVEGFLAAIQAQADKEKVEQEQHQDDGVMKDDDAEE